MVIMWRYIHCIPNPDRLDLASATFIATSIVKLHDGEYSSTLNQERQNMETMQIKNACKVLEMATYLQQNC